MRPLSPNQARVLQTVRLLEVVPELEVTIATITRVLEATPVPMRRQAIADTLVVLARRGLVTTTLCHTGRAGRQPMRFGLTEAGRAQLRPSQPEWEGAPA